MNVILVLLGLVASPGFAQSRVPNLTSLLSVMANGQNLFDAAHAEFAGTASLLLTTQVPRSAGLRLRWTFR